MRTRNVVCLLFILTSILYTQNLTHGPVVGGVTDSSAVFVLRSDAAADLQVEVSVDANFATSSLSATFATVSDSDYFGKVSINSLSANTLYYFRAVIDATPVADGVQRSFRTFPQEGVAANFSFIVGSCQQHPTDPNANNGAIFSDIAGENAYFLLHNGDWGYQDLTHAGFPTTYSAVQSSYQTRYDSTYGMKSTLRALPLVYVYDDHDVAGDLADYTTAGMSNSVRGYRAMFPHYALPNGAAGVWQKFACANADVFVLDNRAQRHPNLLGFADLGDGVLDFVADTSHKILYGNPLVSGQNQMSWLKAELSASTADWKFISTGTPLSPAMRAAMELVLAYQTIPELDTLNTSEGPVPASAFALEIGDKWAGFPHSIFTLVDHIIDNNIQNVIFLSGDTHTSGIDDGANSVLPELMAGPLDRTNSMFAAFLESAGSVIFNQGGHDAAATDTTNAFGRVSVFGADSVRLEIVSETSTVLARYTVNNGVLPASVNAKVAPSAMLFDTLAVGLQDTLPAVVVNLSTDTLSVSTIFNTNPARFSIAPTSFSLAAGGAQILDVIYIPGVAGSVDNAAFSVVSNDLAGPYSILVQGITESDNPVPVHLSAFEVSAIGNHVLLSWTTQSEVNNAGFRVSRATTSAGPYSLIASWETDEALVGAVSSNTPLNYTVEDRHTRPGIEYWYQLEDVSLAGEIVAYPPVSITLTFGENSPEVLSDHAPKEFNLRPPYPNPFNPATVLEIDLPATAQVAWDVDLRIFDVLGKEIDVLYTGTLLPGTYRQHWDGNSRQGTRVDSGVYFAVLRAGHLVSTQRLMLIR